MPIAQQCSSSLSLTLSRLCEEARVERTEHVSIKNTWTPSNSFQVGDFEMTLDSLDDPFFQNWKQWLAAKVQSQEPQDQHHAAPGRALPWLCFFCCASQFMAWRSCANASLGMLGMMGMLGQVWYHPVPWPAKVARPLGIPDFGTKSRPITWRPGIWKMSKGFKRWKHHKTAINHHNLTSVIDNYRHLWPSMATRLRQGLWRPARWSFRRAHPRRLRPDLGCWKHMETSSGGGPLMSSWRSHQKRKLILGIDHWRCRWGRGRNNIIWWWYFIESLHESRLYDM